MKCTKCGLKYSEEPECKEKPEKLTNTPIGMYHCPECQKMVMAGFPHFYMCDNCLSKI